MAFRFFRRAKRLAGDSMSERLRVAVIACLLLSTSCGSRYSAHPFRVVPASPAYALRSPDLRETPFPEILRGYNGFEPGRAWIDLRAGMELRIENAYYQPGMSRRGLNGFLGTEIAQYKAGPQRGLQLLSVQSMQDRPKESLPVQQLISISQQERRYFRFYYEVLFKRSGSSRGSVLLSDDAKDGIDRLADELMTDPDSVCSGKSMNCTVFPEACSVSIEMEIVVNGAPRNVLWGSLLMSVVERPRHLELWRIYQGRLTSVKLVASDTNALRLPLLPGDRVKWN